MELILYTPIVKIRERIYKINWQLDKGINKILRHNKDMYILIFFSIKKKWTIIFNHLTIRNPKNSILLYSRISHQISCFVNRGFFKQVYYYYYDWE